MRSHPTRLSTIASAKGYDAQVVFVIGVDTIPTDVKGRAQFYVGATRARHQLYVSGLKLQTHTLLDECLACVGNP